VNENTTEEIKANEIGGVSSHFNQKLFNDLKSQKKIHLENFVYNFEEKSSIATSSAPREFFANCRFGIAL
jgi:hypothetical protein